MLHTYDLGDPVALSVTIRDAAGALANAGAVTVTIVQPDGTTLSPAVSNPSTGSYATALAPTLTGRHVVRWIATGANASAFTTEFVVVAGPHLITVDMLATHLHASGFADTDLPAAEQAVQFAIDMVTTALGFDIFDPLRAVKPAHISAARGVALRVAAQWYDNPKDRASYTGPEGLAYTPSPQMLSKIMSEADQTMLDRLQLRYAAGF